jgi:predicted O-linked N-acetylglucosamine transferase (SPINDLY family)
MAKGMSAAEAEARFQKAVKAFQGGDHRQARKILLKLEKAVGAVPQLTHLRGFVELELGNLAAAIKALKAARAAMPDDVNLVNALGSALRRSGDAAGAVEHFRAAAGMAPGRADILVNLGNALSDVGDPAGAAGAYARALEINPAMTDVRRSLAADLMKLGAYERLVEELEAIIEADPTDSAAMQLLAREKTITFDYEAARRLYKALSELDPDNWEARFDMAAMSIASGAVRDGIAVFEEGMGRPGASSYPAAAWAHNLNYLPETTPENLLAAGRAWEAAFAMPAVSDAHRPRVPGSAIRFGILTSKLGGHPCGHFLRNWMAARDRGQLSIEIFLDEVKPHWMVDEIRSVADGWHDISRHGPEETLEFIRARDLDVLATPTGMEESEMLRVITGRPARKQIAAFAIFGTTGQSAVDALIADRHHIPEGMEAGFAEKIIRMPGSYISFRPPEYLPDLSERQAGCDRPLTFGCFNALPKLCDGTLALWARVLEAAPGSRLILKAGPLGDESVRRDLAKRFGSAGGDPDRLDLRAGSPHSELLEAYNEIDLALDPLAYSGGLTTLEALWMGVPVVTLPGETFARRHSLSHLSVAGLDAFVARDAEDYLRIASSFPDVMTGMGLDRSGVRHAVAGSPIADGALYADGLCRLLQDLLTE